MSVTKRLVSGALATWMRIAVTILSQILLVPLFLQHWTPNTYGVWLGLQSIIAISQLPDIAHQNFLESEFLKTGMQNFQKFQSLLTSGMVAGFLFGLLVLGLIAGLALTDKFDLLLSQNDGPTSTVLTQATVILITNAAVWASIGSVGGILVRAMSPLGHYSTMAWWGTTLLLVTTCSQAIALVCNGDLLCVGLAAVVSGTIIQLMLIVKILFILRRSGVAIKGFHWKTAYNNLILSQILTFQSLAEATRQHGARLILGIFASGPAIAIFSTTRTGANLALTALSTVMGPALPEMMDYLNQRDQPRSDGIISTIWLMVLVAMIPGVVILQSVAEPLFVLWTSGKLAYDGVLFWLFSSSVLVYAIAQPAAAILKGNNLLKLQLFNSVIVAILTILLLAFGLSWFGLRGAGVALLVAEIFSSAFLTISASRWLGSRGMNWPWQIFQWVIASVAIGILSSGMLVLIRNFQLLILLTFAIVWAWLFLQFWRSIPELAKVKAASWFYQIRQARFLQNFRVR